MPTLNNRVPSYRKHRASGQAVVTLAGQDRYLGPFGTKASRDEYDRVIGEWIAAGRQLPTDPNAVTVAEVVAAFRRHAREYYRDADGNVSKAVGNFDEALRPLIKLYARTPAAEFGPLKLKAVRQAMIDAGRVRSNINRHVTRIRGLFKWAVENEMIPAGVHHGLMALAGLRAGRAGAVEGAPVKPVPVEHVDAVLPYLSRQVRAMVDLQLLTGMRPGEVTIMRGVDIDTTGRLWTYTPAKHKTQVHGHARVVYLGPKAQDVIRPFLRPALSEYIFSPADAEKARRDAMALARTTPLSCGNRRGTNKRKKPARVPGERYTVTAYYRAVIRACDVAFPPPADVTDPADVKQWRKDQRWHVHQLRHNAATRLRKEYGLEAAQVILGHKTLTVTQVYAEKNVEAARRIMGEVG